MLVYGVGAIVVIVLIVVALLLFYRLTRSDAKIYAEAEQKMVTAAKNYYANRQGALPKELGSQVTVDATTLTSSGSMKELSKLVPKGKTCTGKVVITNTNGSYNYTAYLNCGQDYVSVELYKKILDREPLVGSGMGLYKIGNEYVFRGENPNNYVKFAGKLWRIVKIDAANQVELILSEKGEKTAWDDRYNVDREMNDGINDYRVSRIRDFLKNYYNSDVFSSADRLKIADHDLCIGKRGLSTVSNNGSVECVDVLAKEAIGLLPIYDYMRASLDVNCVSAETGACQNYNYLTSGMEFNWWTMTGDSTTTSKVYRIRNTGEISLSKAATSGYVRPVIYFVNTTMYGSGSGTMDDPYVIR